MTIDRVNLTDFSRLTWKDVDPATRPAFDPGRVAELVRVLPPAADVPPPGTDWRLTDFWYDRMTEALVEHLGDWVVGWWYTVAMEDHQDRGVIPLWRARRPPVTTPEETLTRIADAVLAWHELLVELATDARGRFAAAAPAAADGTDEPPAWRAVRGDGWTTVYDMPDDRRLPHPSKLSWAKTDRPELVFDPDEVRAVVSELVAAAEPPSAEADWRLRDLWLENISAGLVDRYGRWAVGWRWAVGEGDFGGGPVGSWCCFPHSVSTPEATASTISAALVEWRDWLDDVAERFDRFLPLAADDLAGWERAVAHLVTAVGDRTQYESGWYGCCLTVLDWFLDAAGIESPRREELLEHAVAGRFESWVEPPRAVVESVAENLARRVAVDLA
ncbi:hypothetical protein GCM10022225_77860 [Plantactinospora mayteni]|uniref:Uncharacterized protein n=1 Tax=Plantactinospora mayteni TaxID=566021 RepID=A0ABQ4ERD5_9ACTN|nr:hypothetical protein [Plantactinospora mayteni]GIG97227.1 hypothetical protein Pma05_38000 [Plantactinospora mayteni]